MASVNSINEKIQNLITSAQVVTKDDTNDLTSQVSNLIKNYSKTPTQTFVFDAFMNDDDAFINLITSKIVLERETLIEEVK